MFGLSAREFAEEPADKLFTNLFVSAQIEKKQELERKHAESSQH